VKIKWLSGLLMLVFSAAVSAQSAPNTILNVSYDVARDLYRDINPAFLKAWKERGGGDLTVNQSHGPSSRQARAVVDGLEADVLTMNQANDLDFAANAGVVSKDWRKKFANNGVPFSSVQIFIVRKGNPKNIKDSLYLSGGLGLGVAPTRWQRAKSPRLCHGLVQKCAGTRCGWPRRHHDLHTAQYWRCTDHIRERGRNDCQRVRARSV